MFKNLSEKFGQIVHKLSGKGRITEDNIQEVLGEIRSALLEADVGLPIVKQFIEDVKQRAVGSAVLQSLTPGQVFVKIVYEELEKLLGESEPLNLQAKPPVVILLAGLQGSGKTTTAAKLARHLKEERKKSVLLASLDVYRPAAILQLQTLANEIQVDCLNVQAEEKPLEIVKRALEAAKNQVKDVLLFDTAGRLHIDDEMMAEIKQVSAATNPTEILLVIDSMMGQDAVQTAKVFNDTLPITGVILTKLDGDARGGAALSIKASIGKPIKFMGVGEKITALEPFNTQSVASRILGMGDIISLVKDVEAHVDKKEAEKLAKKVFQKGQFDLEDFLKQLEQMDSMGGIMNILDKMPGMAAIPQAAKSQLNDKMFKKKKAIIQSMTRDERRFPSKIRGSRKIRISKGSGTQVQDVNSLLKDFEKMQKMMKNFSNQGGLSKLLSGFKGIRQ